VQQRLAAHIARLDKVGLVVDLGGGTGISRHLWPQTSPYICFDVDMQKLQGFLHKYPHDSALLADATRAPLQSTSVQAITCVNVSHHLTDAALQCLIGECRRVLQPAGTFIFIDAVRDVRRPFGMLLWSLDRGSFPHTSTLLQHLLSEHFHPLHTEYLDVLHRYIVWVGTPHPAAVPTPAGSGQHRAAS
jgi:SAM-dependent methyltransferase